MLLFLLLILYPNFSLPLQFYLFHTCNLNPNYTMCILPQKVTYHLIQELKSALQISNLFFKKMQIDSLNEETKRFWHETTSL